MITPMDIHNKTFSKGLRGYSEEEVNDFLRQIVTDYEQIYREHREMEEEMDQMKVKLSNYEKDLGYHDGDAPACQGYR